MSKNLCFHICFALVVFLWVNYGFSQNRSFNNNQLAKILDLTPAQEELRQRLKAEYIDQSAKVRSSEGRQGYQDWLHDLNLRYVRSLNGKQQTVYAQYKNWKQAGSSQTIDTLLSSYSKSLLKLSDTQITKLKKLRDDSANSSKKSKSEFEDRVADNKNWLNRELEEVLERHQLLFYEEQIGEPIDFIKAGLGKVFGMASTMTPKGKISSSRVSASVQNFDPLLLVVPANRVDIPVRYPALVRLLANKTVEKKLQLSERQKSEVESTYRRIQKKLDSIRHIESGGESGDSIRVTDDSGKDLRFGENEETEIEQLEKLLTKSQFVHLIQIYHRFAIEVGANEGIALLHSDWDRFLELSDDQKKRFEDLKKEYVKRTLSAAKKYQENANEARADGYRDGLAILTDDQSKLWSQKMGWFGRINSETEQNQEMRRIK